MPDGTIKVKVQQADGSWKWARPESSNRAAASVSKSAQAGADPSSATLGLLPPAMSTSPTMKPSSGAPASKVSAAGKDDTIVVKPSAKKSKVGRNFSTLFKTARVLDAVLPEHLQVGHDLAEDIGVHESDNDSDNSSADSQHSHKGPSSASSKQLAKLAAGGVKVKVKKAKKSVYKPGEAGSSEDEDFNEKNPSSSVDEIMTVKKDDMVVGKGLEGKNGVQVSEKEIKPLKKRPSKGRQLQRRTSRLAQGIAWSIALFFPLLFLILAFINVSQNGKDAGEYSENIAFATRLQEANKICVSMWPILFGAIVAQSFKMYAAWKVERGIRLVVCVTVDANGLF